MVKEKKERTLEKSVPSVCVSVCLTDIKATSIYREFFATVFYDNVNNRINQSLERMSMHNAWNYYNQPHTQSHVGHSVYTFGSTGEKSESKRASNENVWKTVVFLCTVL